MAHVCDSVPQPELAGWFGKIPALGDFVTRRLPPSFVDSWDEWLSTELVAAQQALDEAWLSAYQHAPILRFALMPGAVDRVRWFGVWVPSFDRVGRRFPLTFAVSGPSGAEAAQRWWAALVATGLRALQPSCDADCVDEALLAFLGRQDAVDDCAELFERRVDLAAASACCDQLLELFV